MKRLFLIFSIFLILGGCSILGQSTSDDLGYETLKNQSHIIKQVTIDEIKNREEKKDTYFLLIGRPSCGVCVESILPFSQEAEKNGLDEVYYFSFEKMYQQFNTKGKLDSENEEALRYLEKYLDFQGATPMFYYIKDGRLLFSSDDVKTDNISSWNEFLNRFFKETAK